MGALQFDKINLQVKTTSPKKYCVRPNAGIIKPKGTCDFTGLNALHCHFLILTHYHLGFLTSSPIYCYDFNTLGSFLI